MHAPMRKSLRRIQGARAAPCLELKERNAAASTADEAMAMILRLQKEKAEIGMEARQYRQMVEEKSAHDEEEMEILKEIIMRQEMEKQTPFLLLMRAVHSPVHLERTVGQDEYAFSGVDLARLNRNKHGRAYDVKKKGAHCLIDEDSIKEYEKMAKQKKKERALCMCFVCKFPDDSKV